MPLRPLFQSFRRLLRPQSPGRPASPDRQFLALRDTFIAGEGKELFEMLPEHAVAVLQPWLTRTWLATRQVATEDEARARLRHVLAADPDPVVQRIRLLEWAATVALWQGSRALIPPGQTIVPPLDVAETGAAPRPRERAVMRPLEPPADRRPQSRAPDAPHPPVGDPPAGARPPRAA